MEVSQSNINTCGRFGQYPKPKVHLNFAVMTFLRTYYLNNSLLGHMIRVSCQSIILENYLVWLGHRLHRYGEPMNYLPDNLEYFLAQKINIGVATH